jgi:predicted lipoprotein with Yx(FWY)xxD motif
MRIPILLAVGAVAALTLTACGSGSGSTTPTTNDAGAAVAVGGLRVADTSLGKVVVDAKGMTVYMLSADSKNHATCDAGCQQYWPATAAGQAPGVTAAVGTTGLPGGGTTDTVGGLPVYTFRLDQKPGDVNGQGVNEFGGVWYAVSPSGTPIMQAAGASPSSASSSPASVGRGY